MVKLVFNMPRKLRFGLPVGSLNHPERWDTKGFLDSAGLYTSGYEPGSRSYYPRFLGEGTEYLEAVAVRPQRAAQELWAKKKGFSSEGLDIAIVGSDWAEEGEAAGYPIKQLTSLGYGKVTLYAAVLEDSGFENVSDVIELTKKQGIICQTEYVHLAAKMILENPLYKELHDEMPPQIEYGGRIINESQRPNPKVRIVYSEGTTESALPSGFAHIIIDNMQKGRTVKENRLKIIDELGNSFARLYAGPHITEEDERWDMVQYVKNLLRGAALARRYIYCIFDFPRKKKGEILNFMRKNNLYEIKPFVQEEKNGDGWCETKILVPRAKEFAVVCGLSNLGAKANVITEPKLIVDIQMTDEEINELLESDTGI